MKIFLKLIFPSIFYNKFIKYEECEFFPSALKKMYKVDKKVVRGFFGKMPILSRTIFVEKISNIFISFFKKSGLFRFLRRNWTGIYVESRVSTNFFSSLGSESKVYQPILWSWYDFRVYCIRLKPNKEIGIDFYFLYTKGTKKKKFKMSHPSIQRADFFTILNENWKSN